MNEDIVKGKWTEIKGEIQKKWGNLKGDDLEKTKGDMKAISGLIQQKYGLAKEEASSKLSKIYEMFHDEKESLGKVVSNAADKAKQGLKNSNTSQGA